MKSNEFRIGNLIYEAGIQVVVNDLSRAVDDWNRINNHSCDHPRFEPIPLTEEWLLKFGFTLIEESYHDFPTTRDTFDKTKTVKRLDREYFITQSDDRHEPDGTEMSVLVILDPETKKIRGIGAVGVRDEFPHAELQYVHQLQNLYFALTGEELLWKK